MSTKKLARTILEAGSSGESKYERHLSTRKERSQTREYLSKVTRDPEVTERIVTPKRGPNWKSPDDNLGAVKRFVDSWVDRKWDKCLSEMMKKFNPKSLAGYHIIYDHILRDIYPNEAALNARPYWRARYGEYYVDGQGILRKIDKIPRQTRDSYNFGPISSWLGNRKIALLGENYYWFVYTKGICIWKELYDLDQVYASEGYINGFQPSVDAVDRKVPACARFRQGKRLNEKELEYFMHDIPHWLYAEILDHAPLEITKRKSIYWKEKAEEKTKAIDAYKWDKKYGFIY